MQQQDSTEGSAVGSLAHGPAGRGAGGSEPAVATPTPSPIVEAYRRRTPESAAFMSRAQRILPAGSTRSFGFFTPYPLVFRRGEGARLWDVDGNEYIDLIGNGMSLIHGHAYSPIVEALSTALKRGTVWPGASQPQVELAELLDERIGGDNLVRFVNSGTEATMLAVKLARHVTGRSLVIKAWGAYHGSADDLEAGLYGIGEIPDRVALARFGDPSSFTATLEQHADRVACVILEPAMFTGTVQLPPPGFLEAVQTATRNAGALFVLDDCVMFRLGIGGSAERFGLRPDVTCLGKWIGGGLPLGAVVGPVETMKAFDLRRSGALQHSGSFNGSRLSCTTGQIAVAHLTAERIERMDADAAALESGLEDAAEELGIPIRCSRIGSAMGIYVLDSSTREIDTAACTDFHLAALNRGAFIGPGGEVALSTCLDEEDVERAAGALAGGLEDVATNRRTEV